MFSTFPAILYNLLIIYSRFSWIKCSHPLTNDFYCQHNWYLLIIHCWYLTVVLQTKIYLLFCALALTGAATSLETILIISVETVQELYVFSEISDCWKNTISPQNDTIRWACLHSKKDNLNLPVKNRSNLISKQMKRSCFDLDDIMFYTTDSTKTYCTFYALICINYVTHVYSFILCN